MIAVRRGSLVDSTTEAILRPVRADLSAVTPGGREIEVAAGPRLEKRLASIGATPLAGAVITPAEEHKADFIVHVVVEAPDERWNLGALQRGLTNGLRRVEELAIESLALPPLGTGVGGLDLQEAAPAMLRLLREHLERSETLSTIEIVVSNETEESLFS